MASKLSKCDRDRHARCPTLIMMAAHSFYIPVVLVDALLQALQELFVLSALVHSSAVKHRFIIHNKRSEQEHEQECSPDFITITNIYNQLYTKKEHLFIAKEIKIAFS